MPKLERFLRLIDNLNEWGGKIISPLCLVMVAILMWEVVLRYFFNKPTIWAHEASIMLFGGYFVLSGGYVLRHRAHVNMDIVYNYFSLRGRAILDLVSSSLFFLFCGMILWYGWKAALYSLSIQETTSTYWEPPWYPLRFTIPVGAFLILLQGLAKFIRDLTIAVTGREAA